MYTSVLLSEPGSREPRQIFDIKETNEVYRTPNEGQFALVINSRKILLDAADSILADTWVAMIKAAIVYAWANPAKRTPKMSEVRRGTALF